MRAEDHQLLERARDGDVHAYGLLYDRYHSRVLRYAASMAGCPSTAEDIAQDVFAAFLAHLARFDPSRAALVSYLFGVVRNLVRERRRRERRLRPLSECHGDQLHTRQPDPRAQLEGREHAARIRRAVNALPERVRAPVLLCDLHGLAYVDAAALLGTSPAALRHRLRDGRGLLRRGLDKTLPNESRARGNHTHGPEPLRVRPARQRRAE